MNNPLNTLPSALALISTQQFLWQLEDLLVAAQTQYERLELNYPRGKSNAHTASTKCGLESLLPGLQFPGLIH
jgi:hypothetical protein